MRPLFLTCVLGSSLVLAGEQTSWGQSPYGANQGAPSAPYLTAPLSGPASGYAGASSSVSGASNYYGGSSSQRPAYGSPSLLPLPSTAPASVGVAPAYAGLRPVAAYTATETSPYQSASGLAEPIPEPLPATASEGLPTASDLPSAANAGSNIGAAPYSAAGPALGGATGAAGGVGRGYDGNLGCCDQNLFGCGCGGLWFGSVGAIGLTRNEPNRFWTTYKSNDNPDQLMNTQFAQPGWSPGGEVTVGRWFTPGAGGGGLGAGGFGGGYGGFGGLGGGGLGGGGLGGGAGSGACGSSCCGGCGCCPIGLAVTYWGITPMGSTTTLTSPNSTLSTPINDGSVNIVNGAPSSPNPASYFWDSSRQQSVSRSDTVNNVEINFMTLSLIGTGRTQAIWLAGVRYFRFDDTLTYGGTAYGYTFSDQNGAQSLYLRDRSVNNLVGPQIGVILNHYITQRFSLFVIPKMALMANYCSCTNTLYTGDGYTQFNLQGSKTECSLLGELDLGANYWITNWCSVYAGYRVIGVTSLALADNQFLPYLADTQGFQQPKTNGDLILSGAFAGMLFRF